MTPEEEERVRILLRDIAQAIEFDDLEPIPLSDDERDGFRRLQRLVDLRAWPPVARG